MSVDVVIGPVLTFAVFNRARGSRHLRRDLTVIGILQAAALACGLSSASCDLWQWSTGSIVFRLINADAVKRVAEVARAAGAPLAAADRAATAPRRALGQNRRRAQRRPGPSGAAGVSTSAGGRALAATVRRGQTARRSRAAPARRLDAGHATTHGHPGCAERLVAEMHADSEASARFLPALARRMGRRTKS